MSDITKRLRLAQINHDALHFGWLGEAADEIAALRRWVAELKSALDEYGSHDYTCVRYKIEPEYLDGLERHRPCSCGFEKALEQTDE